MLQLPKCQTKANQRPSPAMASPDLDLCSLITISDHQVLIPLEDRTKILRVNIYCRHRSCKHDLNSTASSCVEHYLPLRAIQ
jgi:hypothetical protein